MSAELVEERADGVVTLTLSRPERKNGLSGPLLEQLIRALNTVAADARDRVLVLTGAGGAFCSGMDLSERVLPDELTFMRRVSAMCTLLHDLPIPTIAKVRGAAMGFGCNLALCCDLTVASDDAVFGEIFATRGLSLDGGGSWSLPRLVGLSKAKEILFFGRQISGVEAAAIGMVNRSVPDAELDEAVASWTAELARGPRRALSMMKAAVNASHESSFSTAIEREALGQALGFGSPEAREGVLAFREKRRPDFGGVDT
jgi:2-(1,2-epoxy-1,2-dihydrophenyl)acetyl-CoA isomerase